MKLLQWYDREKRSLPWRGETDPYRILVSEVMLQQTRVAVVKERYRKFLRQFPTVSRLAAAKEDSVLAAWSGLGYYRRARALHAAARSVRENGAFPGSAVELMQLPGIGRYTAAAVASIAFGEPVAVVDGNVKRVLQRLSGRELSGDEYWQIAGELLEKFRPGDFNQALMELGATVCLPGQPLCAQCPVTRFCTSRAHPKGNESRMGRPMRRKKGILSYLLLRKDDRIFLRQRPANLTLMPGMWELPQLEPNSTKGNDLILRLRHSITTTDYRVFVYTSANCRLRLGSWFFRRTARTLALTGLARKICQKVGIFA